VKRGIPEVKTEGKITMDCVLKGKYSLDELYPAYCKELASYARGREAASQ
jgi:hypothetical protein